MKLMDIDTRGERYGSQNADAGVFVHRQSVIRLVLCTALVMSLDWPGTDVHEGFKTINFARAASLCLLSSLQQQICGLHASLVSTRTEESQNHPDED